MSLQAWPLLDVFTELQQRQFPLGAREYVAALEALARGFGTGSRDDLVFLCQTLWAKSLEERDQVSQVLAVSLPPKFTPEALAALAREALTSEEPVPEGRAGRGSGDLPSRRTPRRRGSSSRGGSEGAGPEISFRLGSDTQGSLVIPQPQTTSPGGSFDLEGRTPLSGRRMKRVWSYYRRMQRVGPRTELDVQATIEQIYRDAVLVAPALVPRRRNLARLVILQDEGGSMVPFRRIAGALTDSARHGGLGTVSILYFHDVPAAHLFHDPRLTDPIPLEKAIKPFARAGLLIVSDAGAARGGFDEDRIEASARLWRHLAGLAAGIAWLNPTPPERWVGTTAGEIRRRCAGLMFPIDREGVASAIRSLRGRS